MFCVRYLFAPICLLANRYLICQQLFNGQASTKKKRYLASLGSLISKSRRRQQRERHKTTAVYLRYKSLYISLHFSSKQQPELMKFSVVHATWKMTEVLDFHFELNAVFAVLD